MNNKQEGFEEQETQTYAFMSSHINNRLYSPLKTKSKNKISFKSPLTIFNNIHMTLAPEDNLKFDESQQNLEIYVNLRESGYNEQEIIYVPFQPIALRQQKCLQQFSNDSNKVIYEKVSQIFPKKFLCVYNKFQENILLKNDLTIVIKNVSKMIKFELLKSIQCPFLTNITKKQVEKSKETEKDENLSESKIKIRKSQRYDNEIKKENLKKLPSKTSYSHFQLQKSIILNGDINRKISQVQFLSNFQSGNLHVAFKDKLNPYLFYLFQANDTNTHGYNQWFYFGAKLTVNDDNKKFRFLIMNISKQFRFQKEMKLLTLKDNKWTRNTHFNVYRNKYSRYNNCGNLTTLDFQYEFTGQKDQTVFFAFIYPYTFSRLNNFLKQIKSKTYKNLVVSIQSIGRTELTNNIPLVKVEKAQEKNGTVQKFKKSCILIIARQHASETPSSFICQSLIRQLLDQSNEWKNLLKDFSFVIVPMLNPDGVIHGNSRTNIKGYDINRLWQINKNGSLMSMQTEVTNNYITMLQREYIIKYTIDLHSHSKQLGSFVYSCDNNEVSKLFSFYFTQNYPQCVYDKCKVNLSADKRCTFRGQMYHRLGIKNSFTIQTSFYGFRQDKKDSNSKIVPFQMQNFKNIANSLLFALKQTQKTKTKSQAKNILLEKIEIMDAKFKAYCKNNLAKNKENQNSSDSDPEGQYLDYRQRQENGQNVFKVRSFNDRLIDKSIQQKKNYESILRSTQKAQTFVVQNRSLQMISKASCSFMTQEEVKKKRKRILTTKLNRCITQNKEKETYNQNTQSFMLKKYTSQAQKELDFRRTLRRGYRMAHSVSSFYESYSASKKMQKKQQQKNYIIYPTSNDLQINHQKIRQLHQKLFQGKIKVKSLKEQDRLLCKIGKGGNINGDQMQKNKNIFTNKYLRQYSQKSEFSEFLNVAKIDNFKKNSIKKYIN